ncbi:MAG TPA: sugar transferase [Cryptosporangiaceae bacterium]|nr:sugar transferase [Cryptosporangiaceae bacterium]
MNRVIHLEPPCRRRHAAEYPGKRALDLLVVAVLAVPALVLGVLAAIAIRVESRGPVLFRQRRVGLNGETFEVLKFRTMTVRSVPHDPFPDPAHITRVGRVLRRYSLDELPQLVNVARGDMSVVGPRPTLTYQVERYDAGQRQRLRTRPGLTGLAQVSGRNTLTWPERIRWDVRYVATQSLRLDLAILLRSVLVVLHGCGTTGHSRDDRLAAAGWYLPGSGELAGAGGGLTTVHHDVRPGDPRGAVGQ